KPRPRVPLPARLRAAERVEREPADRRGQPGPQVPDRVPVRGPLQAQPRLLHAVLGLGDRPGARVGQPQQPRSLLLERRRQRVVAAPVHPFPPFAPSPAHASNVTAPRTSAWSVVSAPPRSARPSPPGSGTGTSAARVPVARRQVLAMSARLAISGPAISTRPP